MLAAVRDLQKDVEGNCDEDEKQGEKQGLVLGPAKMSAPPSANLLSESEGLCRPTDLNHQLLP